MFGPHALLPRSARLVSRITATKFIPRLTARWDALPSTRSRAMQLRRLIYLRLRRYFRHRSEPDWHFQEKPIHLRWNGRRGDSSTRRQKATAAPPPDYPAPSAMPSAIVPPRRADPTTANIWTAAPCERNT